MIKNDERTKDIIICCDYCDKTFRRSGASFRQLMDEAYYYTWYMRPRIDRVHQWMHACPDHSLRLQADKRIKPQARSATNEPQDKAVDALPVREVNIEMRNKNAPKVRGFMRYREAHR